MKQYWHKLAVKVDGLTLRERLVVFGMMALILVVLVNTFLLDPQFVKQNQLSAQVRQEQAQIAAVRTEIQQKTQSQVMDPDAGNKQRLQAIKQQLGQMHGALAEMQKGLVSPDKMSDLLESMLKQNGKLKLLSLKKIPAARLTDPISAEPGAQALASSVAPEGNVVVDGVYRHGVEIVLEGGYVDMVNYMADLEAMPWQVFWGRAALHVEDYPRTTLTLTLFTVSLDKKWLNI